MLHENFGIWIFDSKLEHIMELYFGRRMWQFFWKIVCFSSVKIHDGREVAEKKDYKSWNFRGPKSDRKLGPHGFQIWELQIIYRWGHRFCATCVALTMIFFSYLRIYRRISSDPSWARFERRVFFIKKSKEPNCRPWIRARSLEKKVYVRPSVGWQPSRQSRGKLRQGVSRGKSGRSFFK